MVIVLMSDAPDRATAVAEAFGWPVRQAGPKRVDQIRRWIEAAINRRESLIVGTPPLARAERAFVARDFAGVRFVSLSPIDELPSPATRQAEEPLVPPPASEDGDVVRAIRDEFGV